MKNFHNYNLIVMIEDTVSSKIWQEEIEQLQNNLTYHFEKNDNKNLVVKNSDNKIIDIQTSLKDKNKLYLQY